MSFLLNSKVCKKVGAVFLFLLLAGCSAAAPSQIAFTPAASSTSLPIPTPTQTQPPTQTTAPLITSVCSPLQGVALNELHLITSNPFTLKYPFSEGPADDPNHPAVDLGFYHFKNLNTDHALPIQALLPGKVVEALTDRFPYGNMVLIETPIDQLSPELLARLKIPAPYSAEEISVRSPCQPDQTRISWSQNSQSIYTLYAHMVAPPTLKAGDSVACGEVLGGIGSSGHSAPSIEHLHLEIRVGPSDAKFGTISAYLSTSTAEERYNYCIWALSEIFQPIDPSLFWNTNSSQG